ncbi:MAG: NAD(P)/FAD-dependent oxidoreductase [Pseudomonadota bacterium]
MNTMLDCVVVGAGVIGLAIARSLALSGREVVVLETEPEIGMHTSSRNSEVIHAGIYYAQGSLKATLCVQGKQMLYDYCAARHIPFQRIGKLIVASTSEEIERLHAIRSTANKNGVNDLEFLNKSRVREMEPAIKAEAGLFSPSTGIIDSHALMLAMQADIEAAGGAILTRSTVDQISITADGFEFTVENSEEKFSCDTLVNSAGLHAGRVARKIAGLASDSIPTVRYAIGHYFAYQGRSPFNHLVYPLPSDGGLGVHATNDMGNSARFGPDVTWIDEIDYGFDESRKSAFADAIRCYFPDLDEKKLVPAYTGIRPKLCGPGEPAHDFLVQGTHEHGVPKLVNLFGIESPGLTSSLAIADYVKLKISHST